LPMHPAAGIFVAVANPGGLDERQSDY
jgi:hypothetical protein